MKYDTTLGFMQSFASSVYFVKVVYDSLKHQCLKESLDMESFKAMVKENYYNSSKVKDTIAFDSYFSQQIDFFESIFIKQLNRHSTILAFYKASPEITFPTNSQFVIVYPRKINRFACGKKIRDENICTLDADIYFFEAQNLSKPNTKYSIKFSVKDELGVMAYKGPYSELVALNGTSNFYESDDYWGPMRETFSALGKKLGRIIRAYNEKEKLPKENPVRYETNNFR
ncbi:MAG: hypothetical protein K2Q22_04040 [Cytophagales bacterium]|nr:hypothetical protein [Cytophagales bacterium]